MTDLSPLAAFLDGTETVYVRKNGVRMRATLETIASFQGISAVAGEDLIAGTPIALSRLDGTARKARADTYALSAVIGMAATDIAAGFPVQALRSFVEISDWTDIAGSPSLTPGASYFLAPGGGLTLTVPNAPDFQSAVRVGQAAMPQTFLFEQSRPILLSQW